MSEAITGRSKVARALNRIDSSWEAEWTTRDANHHKAWTLELVATLLDGEEPHYAEAHITDAGDEPYFQIVVIGRDRIIKVNGAIDDEWPRAIVIPRRELSSLKLRKTPIAKETWDEPQVDSAWIDLKYGEESFSLPLDKDAAKGYARALADMLPSLLADRFRPPHPLPGA